MKILINFKDGTTIVHEDMTLVGQLDETSELVLGNGGEVFFYPLANIDSFTGHIEEVKAKNTVAFRDVVSHVQTVISSD